MTKLRGLQDSAKMTCLFGWALELSGCGSTPGIRPRGFVMVRINMVLEQLKLLYVEAKRGLAYVADFAYAYYTAVQNN